MSSNIKVLCRIRPQNISEKGKECIVKHKGNTIFIKNEQFNFDYVFSETATQQEVFEIGAIPIVNDLLNGYNCTFFVYGQSGTGKTFSISGDDNHPGLTQRIVNKIFEYIYNSTKDFEFNISVSYVEIYLEKIRDLLNINQDNLQLRENKQGEVVIENVTEKYVSSTSDILELFNTGNNNRSIGETKMNKKSSRSHSLFILTLTQTYYDSTISSKLVLVDLAGSEKVKNTGATGLLLKQAQYTNKSLTTLGIVIRALIEGKSHIPYRDAKLTRLLCDSLGGNSKTCLMVTCSPSIHNSEETLSTLRFGTAVKTVKNKPQQNIKKSPEQYKKLLELAEQRIAKLEAVNIAQYKKQIHQKQEIIDVLEETVQNLEETNERLKQEIKTWKNKYEKIKEKEFLNKK